MIIPIRKDEALLADIQKGREDRDNLYIWWLGQSGFLVCHEGKTVLFDPYLSDSLTRKYAETDKPHIRMTERAIAPEKLDFIDVVTSSHNHTDHLDAETLKPLMADNPELEIVIPEANREFVANRLGCDPDWPIGLTQNSSAEVSGVTFHGVSAAHNEVEKDSHGYCKFMGFLLQIGRFTLYHSGDTLLHAGLEERLKEFQIHVGFLPINGNVPERRVAGNLSGKEAASLAKKTEIGLAIPHHFEMFKFNTVNPEEFVESCESLGQHYSLLQCGQHVKVD